MKKILLYGSAHCGDCGPVKEVFSQDNVNFVYMDITSGMLPLKKFLKIRDHADTHAGVREKGSIGIPTLVVDDVPYLVNGPDQARELIQSLNLKEA